jgi:hypothetical protein
MTRQQHERVVSIVTQILNLLTGLIGFAIAYLVWFGS